MVQFRFLIAEDDPVIAMDIGATLSDAGYSVSDVVEDLETLEDRISQGDFDAAFLAVRIRDGLTFAAAQRISETGRPVGFVTGWSVDEMPLRLQRLPIIGKPFVPEALGMMADDMAVQTSAPLDTSKPQSTA